MNVMVVLGTRPEVIKLAPVIAELSAKSNLTLCSSGQHREMLDQSLDAFSLKPDVKLETMSPGRSLNILASRLLEAFDIVFDDHKPDWVLVQGDTTTAFCAGLAAFQRGFRVAHVEAGLRTGDLRNPFPEEANRNLLARIASIHFAPTRRAADALMAEGIQSDIIYVTGNTLVDSIQQITASWPGGVPANLPDIVRQLTASRMPLVLVTCHRRENFGDVMEGICRTLARLCAAYPSYQWIFPVHLNPGVREPAMRMLGNIPNLHLTDPVDYHTSLYLISKAALVITDSGGIQEEAPTFGTPAVVMRQHTERIEGVVAGFATLAGQDPAHIEAAVRSWLDNPEARKGLQGRPNPYGDGCAAQRIAATLNGEPTSKFDG